MLTPLICLYPMVHSVLSASGVLRHAPALPRRLRVLSIAYEMSPSFVPFPLLFLHFCLLSQLRLWLPVLAATLAHPREPFQLCPDVVVQGSLPAAAARGVPSFLSSHCPSYCFPAPITAFFFKVSALCMGGRKKSGLFLAQGRQRSSVRADVCEVSSSVPGEQQPHKAFLLSV